MRDRRREALQRAELLQSRLAIPADFGAPVRFGDNATRDEHARKCTAIRYRMHTHQFEVAPTHTVFTASGEPLAAGMVVTPEHFYGAVLAPSVIIDWLVARGVVLESLVYVPPDSPQAA